MVSEKLNRRGYLLYFFEHCIKDSLQILLLEEHHHHDGTESS